ncbi:MAG TPA: XrtA system polysaccharide chain length determinant [Stellaceae bacterium]|nr:XrtA system polysaccharide chain length determinant [Stellaceae bacterium]
MDRWYALVRQACAIAWRRRWLLVAAAWGVCLLGWVGVHFIPNSYESEARLYVDTDAVLTPLLRGLAIETRTQSQLDMMQRTLLARPNLDKLISATNLNLYVTDPAQQQALVQNLAKAVAITNDGPNLFTIRYRNKNPQLAFQVVSGLVNIFMEEATGSSMSDMQNAQRFLNEQIALFEKQLRAAEQRRAAFISKYYEILPMAGNGGAPVQAAAADVSRLEAELQRAETGQAALQEELRVTPQTLQGQLPPGLAGTSRDANDLATQLAAAESKLNELLVADTEQNPDVIMQQKMVAALKAQIQQALKQPPPADQQTGVTLPNPAYEQDKMRHLIDGVMIADLKQQLAVARAKLAHLETLARSVPEVQAKYENLDRGYAVLRRQYEELLSRREASLITAAADTGADRVRLRVIDPPQLPIDPVAPPRILLDSGVLLAGLGAAAGLALLLAQTDESTNDIGQLRELGVPVLGAISAIIQPHRRRVYFQGVTLLTALLVLIAMYGGLAIHQLPHGKGFF